VALLSDKDSVFFGKLDLAHVGALVTRLEAGRLDASVSWIAGSGRA